MAIPVPYVPTVKELTKYIEKATFVTANRDSRLREILNGIGPEGMSSRTFILINFSVFHSGREFVPAEVGLCAFSLENGIKDMYSTLIDPKSFPSAFTGYVRRNAADLAIPEPGFDERCQDIEIIYGQIRKFVEKNTVDGEEKMILCRRSEITRVEGCLEWMVNQCENAEPLDIIVLPLGAALYYIATMGRRLMEETLTHLKLLIDYEDEDSLVAKENKDSEDSHLLNIVRDYSLSTGTYQTLNAFYHSTVGKPEKLSSITWTNDSILLGDPQCEEFFNSLDLSFSYELACPHHMTNLEGVPTCPLNVVNRNAFRMIQAVQKHYAIPITPGVHSPFKDHKKTRDKVRNILAGWEIYGYRPMGFYKGSYIDLKEKHVEREEEEAVDFVGATAANYDTD